MLWSRSGHVGWLRSVSWVCLSLGLGLWLTASTALCQEPSSGRSPGVLAETDSTVTLSREALLLLLDDIAYMEVDLSECRTRLEWATETPPECESGGVPWTLVLASVVLGGLVVGVID